MASNRNAWVRLNDLCEILHPLLYEKQDLAKAKELLSELEEVLFEASTEMGAIITAEGFALYHEIRREYNFGAFVPAKRSRIDEPAL